MNPFKKKTTTSILSSFHKQIKELDALAAASWKKSSKTSNKIAKLYSKRCDFEREATKAQELSMKISSFVQVD